jgi:hypothetical protein
MADGQNSRQADKAIVALSVQVTDGTRYETCSIFVGRSAATSQWFAWPVQADGVAMIALEVEPGDYGFHRFGCTYRSLQITTGVAGPQLTINPGDVIYLGRLIISDTEIGSAAGHSRMPTSVALDFVDRQDEDFDAMAEKWPVFGASQLTADVPATWGGDRRYQLRPYMDGVKLVAAPIL